MAVSIPAVVRGIPGMLADARDVPSIPVNGDAYMGSDLFFARPGFKVRQREDGSFTIRIDRTEPGRGQYLEHVLSPADVLALAAALTERATTKETETT